MICGDLFNCHRSTVCRLVPKVLEQIAKLLPETIKMPSTVDELNTAKARFYRLARFPGVIGAIGIIHCNIFTNN